MYSKVPGNWICPGYGTCPGYGIFSLNNPSFCLRYCTYCSQDKQKHGQQFYKVPTFGIHQHFLELDSPGFDLPGRLFGLTISPVIVDKCREVHRMVPSLKPMLLLCQLVMLWIKPPSLPPARLICCFYDIPVRRFFMGSSSASSAWNFRRKSHCARWTLLKKVQIVFKTVLSIKAWKYCAWVILMKNSAFYFYFTACFHYLLPLFNTET